MSCVALLDIYRPSSSMIVQEPLDKRANIELSGGYVYNRDKRHGLKLKNGV